MDARIVIGAIGFQPVQKDKGANSDQVKESCGIFPYYQAHVFWTELSFDDNVPGI